MNFSATNFSHLLAFFFSKKKSLPTRCETAVNYPPQIAIGTKCHGKNQKKRKSCQHQSAVNLSKKFSKYFIEAGSTCEMEVVYLIRAARIKIRKRFDAFIFLSFFLRRNFNLRSISITGGNLANSSSSFFSHIETPSRPYRFLSSLSLSVFLFFTRASSGNKQIGDSIAMYLPARIVL